MRYFGNPTGAICSGLTVLVDGPLSATIAPNRPLSVGSRYTRNHQDLLANVRVVGSDLLAVL